MLHKCVSPCSMNLGRNCILEHFQIIVLIPFVHVRPIKIGMKLLLVIYYLHIQKIESKDDHRLI